MTMKKTKLERCSEVIGVAYNEVSKPIEVQCRMEAMHTGDHRSVFAIGNRDGEISWRSIMKGE